MSRREWAGREGGGREGGERKGVLKSECTAKVIMRVYWLTIDGACFIAAVDGPDCSFKGTGGSER